MESYVDLTPTAADSRAPIREEFSVDLRDLRVMILGAGGAARAIALECAKSNCERLVIANGTFEKGERLAEKLRDFFQGPKVFGPVPRFQAIPWEGTAFRFQIANIDLIVNATPVGLNRGDPSPIAVAITGSSLDGLRHVVFGERHAAWFRPHGSRGAAPPTDYRCCCIRARWHLKSGSSAKRRWKSMRKALSL